MKNGSLDQYLDTGWYSESTLFLNGYIYWCEAQYDSETNTNQFFVDRWRAENENDKYYHSVVDGNGKLEWQRVYTDSDPDLDAVKKRFLQAKIFDGKTFWEAESELAWLEESEPVHH